jgi:hypothetical protein
VISTPRPEKSGPSATEFEDGSNNKQKWGQRGYYKISSSVVYMIKLDSNEIPSEPPEARKAFKRASGF